MADTADPRDTTPVPSATLLLVRDGASGLEVFMVKRHHRIDFVPGAMVFPGGKVDPADADPELRVRCRGVEGLSDGERAVRLAAIREAFEECGVLLARRRGDEALLSATDLAEVAARHREALHGGRRTLAQLVETEDLELACELPVPFARWITPEGIHRRYDTHFFLVPAPADQLALHDGRESVDSVWISPEEALREERAQRLTIIFPTLMQLQKLGRSHSVAEAVAAARSDTIVTVLPEVVRGEGEPVVRIPAEAGYDVVEAPVSQLFRPGR